MSVCLVTVCSGDAYFRYAEQLGQSADQYFHPSDDTGFLILEGRDGWPAATLYRYHALLESEQRLRRFDHVFLIDADMRFEAPVGDEVIGRLVATLHPGYVNAKPGQLPFERDVASVAYVPLTWDASRYYAGGFVGGETDWFLWIARRMRDQIDLDAAKGVTARWHDESHLNRILYDTPPTVTLSPSYCYPDDDTWYRSHGWTESYERKLVALDKTSDERRGR